VVIPDSFQGVFELAVIIEPAADQSDLFAAQAELACAATGITDAQDREGMAFAASALGTAAGMADGALD
jgi:hypothetical protein